jgi:signal transduction histidine kinase
VTASARARPAAEHPPLSTAQAAAIESFADVLAHGDHDTAEDDFYSRLCEATTRATSMRRAIIFLYDSARRRVRAAGSHGVDISVFADAFITVESAPMARRALELDSVIEASHDLERELPAEYVRLFGTTTVVCSPMAARGRWLGAILADRGADGPPLEEPEREVLWILGKTAALAAMARAATRQREKARQLEHRIDLAREVHENVVQRLFGVSLALAAGGPLDEQTRARCADELQRSLLELRSALQRPLGRTPPATQTTLAAEVRRLQHEHPDLGIVPEDGSAISAPAAFEALAQSALAEAIRNAHRHARPTRVAVRTAIADGNFVMEVSNDGVEGLKRRPGMGLRLAAVEAIHAGGVLEFGPRGPSAWQVRLVVPCAEA